MFHIHLKFQLLEQIQLIVGKSAEPEFLNHITYIGENTVFFLSYFHISII